jgi:hypothetical protein
MHGPTKPPTFDPRDWAQFDFSRGHLDGLPVEAMPAVVADLTQRLFGSEEWRQHFQASLPALQRGVLDAYRENVRQLEQEKTTVAREFDERIAAARTRSEDFGKATEAAGSSAAVRPDLQTYHLGVRVTAAADARLGLPGLVVQVTAPRDKIALAKTLTDSDGNARLVVRAIEARKGTKAGATLEILTVDGKSLQRLPDAVYIRPNQAETKVVSLKDSAETAPLRRVALEMRSQREARAREMVTSIDRLHNEREGRLRDLDERLEADRQMIAQLEGATATATAEAARPAEPEARPESEPSLKQRPSAARKERKRS